ncbi:MAG TPA: hypothetical protein VHX62_17025 [Solirubrobacteraceae bacterium]|jgi:hypothetical protein|nr:hypothetical protein [Solirubrobacteraceae bacterium]
MPEYRYSVAEYDPARPWIVVGEVRQLTVSLSDDEDFTEWAACEWPAPRYEVRVDPWQLSPERG